MARTFFFFFFLLLLPYTQCCLNCFRLILHPTATWVYCLLFFHLHPMNQMACEVVYIHPSFSCDRFHEKSHFLLTKFHCIHSSCTCLCICVCVFVYFLSNSIPSAFLCLLNGMWHFFSNNAYAIQNCLPMFIPLENLSLSLSLFWMMRQDKYKIFT